MHGLDEQSLQSIIQQLHRLAVVVPLPVDVPLVVEADPKDNPIVPTAISGRADALCTLDHHLHDPNVVAYCRQNGVRVIDDTELLGEIRG